MKLLCESPFDSTCVEVWFERGQGGCPDRVKGYIAYYLDDKRERYEIGKSDTPEGAIKLTFAWACGYLDGKGETDGR